MSTWFPLLIVLACPLMMIFMMRGMNAGHGRTQVKEDNELPRAIQREPRDDRLAELEREVAQLRAALERTASHAPPVRDEASSSDLHSFAARTFGSRSED